MVVGGLCWQFQLHQGPREPCDDDSVDSGAPLEIEDDVKCHSLSTSRHIHRFHCLCTHVPDRPSLSN